MITNPDEVIEEVRRLCKEKKPVLVLQNGFDKDKFAIAYEEPESIEPIIIYEGREPDILHIIEKVSERHGDALRQRLKQLSRK